MLSKDICRHASLEAKGGAGMVALAGEKLNLVLQDLKLNRDLKVNRVTTTLNLGAGTNGPFTLPSDYLRTYDMFYLLQGPNGSTQFLSPITMEQYDAEFKTGQAANYPYEFATDLSTQAQAATAAVSDPGGVASITVVNPGFLYTSPPTVVFALIGPGGGSGAAGTAYLGITLVTIVAPGAGYIPGDLLTVVGGTGLNAATILVQSIGGGGTVATASIYFTGNYSALPGAGFTVSGGSGTGATFTVASAGVSSVTVTAPGSGYTTTSLAVSFGGGGGGQATATYTLGSGGTVLGKGQLYIYPQSNGALPVTHRYMRDQPDIATPETSTDTPWFPYDAYLIKATAAAMMGITGDERQAQFEGQAEAMLRPHLIMEGDEQQTVRSIRLDPRRFNSNRGLRPTKTSPW